MRELLERWARVEPKRCVRGVADVYTAKIRGVSVWLNEYGGAREVHPERILGAVIEAVEARGWDWTVTTSVLLYSTREESPKKRVYDGFVHGHRTGWYEEYHQDSGLSGILCLRP